MLKRMFNARDEQKIMLLINTLYGMTMKEESDITTYMIETIDMKN